MLSRAKNWSVGGVFQAFAIFCGMGINNSRMYEQVVKAMARQSIALDILAYHTSASVEEVQRLKVFLIYFVFLTVTACELCYR